MRSISRIEDVSINTVSKLLVEAGKFCSNFHDDNVRGIDSKRIQADEVWTFCYAKQKNVESAKAAPAWSGDTWTWTAIDADNKMLVSWLVGNRTSEYCNAFMEDLRERVTGRVQISTDGLKAYPEAVELSFGGNADFGQLIKTYGQTADSSPQRRYSPAEFVCAQKRPISGKPDFDHISTSYVERLNLSIRMGVRRYTRLSNAFSKKLENHVHMVAIWVVFYNWIRIHKTLKVTPAMEAGLTDTTMEWSDIIEQMDAARPAKTRGPYKIRARNDNISN